MLLLQMSSSETITYSIRVNANTKRIFDCVCERIETSLNKLRASLAQRGLLGDYTPEEINTMVDEARKTPLTKDDKEFVDGLLKNK